MLFPVFNMLTGPATHGLKQTGGIFKFLKRATLLEERYPAYLSEVLHFLDFGLSPVMLDRWLPRDGSKALHDWMDEWFIEEELPVSRTALFADSGGFRLLFNTDMDIEHFGLRATPEGILSLQLRYGADLAASLDYPLPPNTPPREEQERARRSLNNALRMLSLLHDVPNLRRPFPYLAVHGQTPASIGSYVQRLLKRIHGAGIDDPFGLAIGSLVPRRSNYETIVALVHGAVEAVGGNPWFDPSTIPIHVFGVSGDMIPVLVYLGVDTFDSSSHVQSARALGYYDPDTWRPVVFHELTKIGCSCGACQEIERQGLRNLQRILRAQGFVPHHNKRTGEDLLKSEVYALIARHNLLLQVDELEETKRAIFDGNLIEHLVRAGSARQRTESMLTYLASVDEAVATRLVHMPATLFAAGNDARREEIGTYSLSHTSDDFNVENRDYKPQRGKDILILVPCSVEKPYSQSRSHRLLATALKSGLGADYRRVAKVSVSGLYGPVPEEFEELEEVRGYNYHLTSAAHDQIRMLTDRLVRFLQRHGEQFSLIVGYSSSKPYRKVMGGAFRLSGYGSLLPTRLTSRAVMDFGRRDNLEQLICLMNARLGSRKAQARGSLPRHGA
jgi:tRNA-guanine family transglycosylase